MSGVQSIQRAFALLRALAVGSAGVTDLAERADLPKSTVARLLSALEEEGAVEQLSTGGEYRLGTGLIDLAGAVGPGRNLIAAARPYLLDLMEQTKETSGVAVLEGTMAHYLDNVESDEEVQVRGWTGELIPLNVVSSGIVLLAGQPQEFVDRYLSKPLTRSTKASVTDREQIKARLKQVKADGYIWMYAEFDESINSVAAPVIDGSRGTVAALHVHGPAYRFPAAKDATAIGQLVRDAAEKLSVQLR